MILTALKELAEREGLVTSPDLEIKTVHFRVTVGPEGKLLGFSELGSSEGKKVAGVKAAVPRPLPGTRRTVVSDPYFLVENASFVFGINAPADYEKRRKEGKLFSQENLSSRRNRFRALIGEAASTTGDEALRAIDQLLGDLAEGKQAVAVPANVASNHLIDFLYYPHIDIPTHLQPEVVSYWSRRRVAGAAAAGEDGPFQCLVTGERCPPAEKHPLVKKVPGGTPSGIAFVSFNDDAFESYGLVRAENAPVSSRAADAYTEALKRLLDDAYPDPRDGTPMPRRSLRLSADTAVLFWSKGNPEEVNLILDAVDIGSPAALQAVYSSVWKGRQFDLDNPAAFYTLTLTGGQGRGTVRGWQETTLGQVLRNLNAYFGDLDLVRPPADAGRPRPLLGLLRQLAVQGKVDNVPRSLAADLFAAILAGRPFPRAVLDAAVRRGRAEWTLYADRASLIKAYLCRARRAGQLPNDFPEVQRMLDENCPAQAYRLGRLFAVLEKVQQEATKASTTIRDRFYGAASATPLVVFPQLLRKVTHHLPNSLRPRFYEKLLQEIFHGLPPEAFPTTLSLEQQGLFAIGYYHESQSLYDEAKNAERKARYFPKTQGD